MSQYIPTWPEHTSSTEPPLNPDIRRNIDGAGSHRLYWTASPTSNVTGYRLCTNVTSYCLELPSNRTSYVFPNLCDIITFILEAQSDVGYSREMKKIYTFHAISGKILFVWNIPQLHLFYCRISTTKTKCCVLLFWWTPWYSCQPGMLIRSSQSKIILMDRILNRFFKYCTIYSISADEWDGVLLWTGDDASTIYRYNFCTNLIICNHPWYKYSSQINAHSSLTKGTI